MWAPESWPQRLEAAQGARDVTLVMLQTDPAWWAEDGRLLLYEVERVLQALVLRRPAAVVRVLRYLPESLPGSDRRVMQAHWSWCQHVALTGVLVAPRVEYVVRRLLETAPGEDAMLVLPIDEDGDELVTALAATRSTPMNRFDVDVMPSRRDLDPTLAL